MDNILKFIKLTHKFQKIERRLKVVGEDRNENDSEHSYQLAMLAWYIADSKNLSLNKDMLIKYALIHDFVEIYAGDTYFYASKEEKNSKEKREEEAMIKINGDVSEFKEFNTLISQYQNKSDEESRFIYALDKILPILNIYIDNGRTWKLNNITFDMLVKGKSEKVQGNEVIRQYFDEIVKILERDKDKLF